MTQQSFEERLSMEKPSGPNLRVLRTRPEDNMRIQTDERRPPRLLFSVEEAGVILGLGRTKVFELVGSGALGSVRVGRRRLVSLKELEAFIERLRRDDVSEASSTAREARRRRGVKR